MLSPQYPVMRARICAHCDLQQSVIQNATNSIPVPLTTYRPHPFFARTVPPGNSHFLLLQSPPWGNFPLMSCLWDSCPKQPPTSRIIIVSVSVTHPPAWVAQVWPIGAAHGQALCRHRHGLLWNLGVVATGDGICRYGTQNLDFVA